MNYHSNSQDYCIPTFDMFPHTCLRELIPCEPKNRGLVPGGKNANRQKRGFVPARDFANRRGE